MVESYGVARTEADLGAWVGAAGAAVSVGQLISSYVWGALSDRIGRRPVMLMGMFNSTFSVLIFGTAKTYPQCVLGRFLSGLLNGNAGVVKTYVGETTEKSQQTTAFSIFALAFGGASVVAPAIGGFLQSPAKTWPATFENTIFETFPFLLPMLCAACLTTTGGVLGFMYAPETASQWRRMERRRRDKILERGSIGANEIETSEDEEKNLLVPAEVEMTQVGEGGEGVTTAQVEQVEEKYESTRTGKQSDCDETLLLSATRRNSDDATTSEAGTYRNSTKRKRLDALIENGWNTDTVTAAAAYALLAFIAIGYDEILPVFAKTSTKLGGLNLSASQIGVVLITGGVFLLLFQVYIFPLVLKNLGVTKSLRFASLVFALVSLIAPCASVHGVVEDEKLKWTVLLLSQVTKIATLAVLFTTVIMAVNNSCLNLVKGRVNGAATTLAAFARIVSPILHGVVFSASLKVSRGAFLGAYSQFYVFCFVSVSSLALWAVASRLPSTLDQPPNEHENEETRKT